MVTAALRAVLASSPLLLQNSEDIIHFTQSLEVRDEIQQLCVRHVIKPGGYRYLNMTENSFLLKYNTNTGTKRQTNSQKV